MRQCFIYYLIFGHFSTYASPPVSDMVLDLPPTETDSKLSLDVTADGVCYIWMHLSRMDPTSHRRASPHWEVVGITISSY